VRQLEAESGVTAIIHSLMNQVSQPLQGYGKEVAHVVN
jgi:hypothetical protein